MSTPPGFPPNQPNPQTQHLPPQGYGPQRPGPQGPGAGPHGQGPGPHGQGPQGLGPQGPGPQGRGPQGSGLQGPPPGRHQQFGGPNPQHGPPDQPFGPNQQFGGPTKQSSLGVSGTIWLLGLLGLAAVALGLSVEEDGNNAWHTVHAWGGLAIAGSLLTLAPVALTSLGRQRAWQVSACGAAALVLFWVLFTLPTAGSNTSLAITVGVACGVVATWIAPGRELPGRELPGRELPGRDSLRREPHDRDPHDRGHHW